MSDRAARRADTRLAWLFLAPALAVYAAVVIVPVLETSAISLFRWDGRSRAMTFIALGNFRELLCDAVFWRALWHNLLLVVLSIVIQIPVALLLAAGIAGVMRGRWFWRTACFAPMVLPSVVIAIVWGYVYDPIYGLLNSALSACGLEALCRGWLGNATTALPAIIVIICWRHIGFHVILLSAGMSTIPHEVHEAAMIDGASSWGRFRHLTVPLMSRFLGISVVLSIVGSLKYFDLVYLLTGGGPPDHATELVATYVYAQGIDADRWGYGSAVAVALLVVSMSIVLVVRALRGAEEQR